MVGVDANNPTLANKYQRPSCASQIHFASVRRFIQRLGHKSADFPLVQDQAKKKSLRWMVASGKALEFGEDLVADNPSMQRFLGAI
jgi:hypothetical protein